MSNVVIPLITFIVPVLARKVNRKREPPLFPLGLNCQIQAMADPRYLSS